MTAAIIWPAFDGARRRYRPELTKADIAAGKRFSCHGIMAQALREAGLSGKVWSALAPALECAFIVGRDDKMSAGQLATMLSRFAEDAGRTVGLSVPAAAQLAEAVLAGGVRGYGQGIEAATRWLTCERLEALMADALGRGWTLRANDWLALEAVKEGHMSSVIVARAKHPGGRTARIVLNVARDSTAAAREQAAVEAALEAFGGDGAVRVLTKNSSTARWFGRDLPLTILATSFAVGEEVHPLPPEAPGQPVRLVRVIAFDESPGVSVPALRGRLLAPDAAARVWTALAVARTRAARFSGECVHAPAVELADGDVVATETGAATIVATEAARWEGPAAWWPYHVALASARNDRGGGRLWWNEPRAAAQAVIPVLRRRAPGALLAAAALCDAELDAVAACHGGLEQIPAGLLAAARAEIASLTA